MSEQSTLEGRALYYQQTGNRAGRDKAVAAMLASARADWTALLLYWDGLNKGLELSPEPQLGERHVFVVLGAGLKPDGSLSGMFLRRLRVALAAYQAHPSSSILVSGGAPKNGKTEGAAGRAWLIAQGVPSTAVLSETKSASTVGNAKYSMEIIKTKGFSSYTLISDATHLRRASVLFYAARMRLGATAVPTAPLPYVDSTSAAKPPTAVTAAVISYHTALLLGVATEYAAAKKYKEEKPVESSVSYETLQEIMLAWTSDDVAYVLGAEATPPALATLLTQLPKGLPSKSDCSETVQYLFTLAGAGSIGDGAAYQWAKCRKLTSLSQLPAVGGLMVLHNNRTRPANVGHIGVTMGFTPSGGRYVLESRGRAWGTVATRWEDFLRRFKSSFGVYPKLSLSGAPVLLYAWRGTPRKNSTKAVQQLLKRGGFTDAAGKVLAVDGDYGPKTVQAVRKFQKATKRIVSGGVTVPTYNALKAYIKQKEKK